MLCGLQDLGMKTHEERLEGPWDIRKPALWEVKESPVLHASLQVSMVWKCSSLNCVWFFVTLGTIACQAPLSVRFSRQEYWSGLPFPSPGDLPDPGIKPQSPALQADALTSEPPVVLGGTSGKESTTVNLLWVQDMQERSVWSLSREDPLE